MYTVTGVTGQVGGQVARILRAANLPIRAVLRDPSKAAPLMAIGCEVAIADISDAVALTKAFLGSAAVFVILPPSYDPAPGFPEVHTISNAIKTALEAAKPKRVVIISTVGAQAKQPNLLSSLGIMEEILGKLSLSSVTFLRPAWFMENAAWDVSTARQGTITSFLQPIDKAIPMVATLDIATVAARLLQEEWHGKRVVELEGPKLVSPNEIAATFSNLLHRPVVIDAVPRAGWEALFRSQGMKNPLPRIQMLDGFNEGWLCFETPATVLKGTTSLETVLRALLAK